MQSAAHRADTPRVIIVAGKQSADIVTIDFPTAGVVLPSFITRPRSSLSLASSLDVRASDSPAEAAFERLSNLAKRLLRAPTALVSTIEGDARLVVTRPRLTGGWMGDREAVEAYCLQIVRSGLPLVINDVRQACPPATVSHLNGEGDTTTVVAYLGVPLLSSCGAVLGSFGALDTRPREWRDEEVDTLRDLAAAVVTEIELRTATRALSEQQIPQAALLDHSTDLICAVDRDGRIAYVNMAWQKALGYSLEEATRMNPVELVTADFRVSFRQFMRSLHAGDPADFEAVLLSKSGRRLVCSGQGWPHLENGAVTGTYAVYRDLTAHSRSEHVRERLVSTLEASPDFVSIVTADGRLVYLNHAARQLVGLDDEADTSAIDLDVLRGADEARRIVTETIPLAIREGVWCSETTLLDADGTAVPVAQTVIAHRSTRPDTPPFFFSIVARDLRERVRAERERRQSEERFRAAMEASMDGFFVMSSVRDDSGAICDFRIEDVNERACVMMSRTRDGLVGQLATETWPSARTMFSDLTSVAETGRVVERELAVTAIGMVASWVQVQVVKVGDGIGATTRDISARKSAEAALERDRAFHAAMLEHLSEGIIACDAHGQITLFNRATRDFLGLAEPHGGDSVLLNAPNAELGDQTTPHPHATPLMRALRGELVVNHEIIVARPTESPRTLLANGRQFFDRSGRLLGAVVASRDVTTQKVVERALRDSEERFRSVVECLDEGVIITDLNGVATYANDRLRDITGYDPSELVGRRPNQMLMRPEARAAADDHLEGQTRGIRGRYTTEHIRKDGSSVWVEVSFVPYRDGTGTVVGTVGSLIDISERRRWEAALLDAKNEAERANQAKSAILSRASHELRTPLNSVIGFSGVLLKNRAGTLSESDLSYMQRIRANGGHLLSLVNDILDIAKVEAGHTSVDLSTVNVADLVCDVVASLEGRVLGKQSLTLRACVPDRLQPIITDAAKLRRILTNLVGNAIKFTPAGTVTVRVLNDDTDHPRSIVVEDTGCGIASDDMRMIFEAFGQSAAVQPSDEPGTGLGLSIAASFCELLGYRIRVESELGVGSRFSVDL